MTQEQKELVELAARVSPKDAPAAKRMLESLLVDPFWLSLRAAPCDDEPVTQDEHAAIEEARGSVRRGEPLIAQDEVLREFGM